MKIRRRCRQKITNLEQKIFMSSKHNPSSEITNLSETNLTIPKKQLALLKKNQKLLY